MVLDTDVASALLRGRVSGALHNRLTGQWLAITFVTVGELTKWTFVRHWGPQRLAGMRRFLSSVVVLPYAVAVAVTWGRLQAHGQLRGRPRPANDTWIAACCLVRQFPLATLNVKDFTDYAESDGLQLLPQT
ncbi:MAG TPA: type II toxin-antitoxin system VapC family toxin [Actinophytocola sp.]|uniref:type II toxin-antitoxin system VapC family toxin n=1 Tax=Actinophytocola sp. TaxID=1872138 RepID=UPI002DBF3263|nr:type II toxin-antitoxin system VapC family toxin [Actinophytocola sp.]HEU5475220.1 type II toxin-antitoxin system VapC family toxin [Actinophytocola sp.]